jgi:hypothetical protein
MSVSFDLTTLEGGKKALQTFDKYGWLVAPQLWLAKKAFEMLSKSGPDTIEAQKKAAVEIIKAGREQNVDTIRITLDQKAGLDLGSDVEGIPIKAMAGTSGQMVIEVTYKRD